MIKLNAAERILAAEGKSYTVQYTYKDPSGKGTASGKVTVNNCAGTADAKIKAKSTITKTRPGQEPKQNVTITRVTPKG